MECNKDEAMRAKAIAEKRLLEKDFTGAKKFALKAQNLFPKLDGLSQFLEIIRVYAVHEKKINGEQDYYGIFGVDLFADEEVLKKQYKRMALSLHPDKNKSVGSDGAFKIMSQAWSVLSDKDKRSAYNLKLRVRAPNQSSSFSSSNVRHTHPAANQWSAPMTATSQPCSSASHHPWNTTFGTKSEHIPTHPQTAAGPTVFSPAPQQPFNPTPGTSSVNVTGYQKSSATATPRGPVHVPHFSRNAAPLIGNLTPRSQKTPPPSSSGQHVPASGIPSGTQFHPLKQQPTSSPPPSRPETFWTTCNRCKAQFEYQRLYLNQNLLCCRCKKPFLATEMPAPNVRHHTSLPRPVSNQQQNVSAASSGSRSMPATVTRTSRPSSSQQSGKHDKRRRGTTVNMGRENDPLMKNNCSVPENVETAPISGTVPSGVKREKAVKRRRTDGHEGEGTMDRRHGTSGCKSRVKNASASVRKSLS